MIIKGRFVRGNREKTAKHLAAHLRYIEHRSRDEQREDREDRHLFGRDSDQVDCEEAVSDVMDHTSTSVNYHKIVLSPGPDEPIDDYRQWVRDVMHDMEEQQGRDLHWYASYHANTEHPHVHLILAGSGENLETGEAEPVKLYRDDYQHLRESAINYSERDWYLQISDALEEFHERDTVVRNQEHDLSHENELSSPQELQRGEKDYEITH